MKKTILKGIILVVIFAMSGAALIVYAGEDTANRPFGEWLLWKAGAAVVMMCAFLLGRWAYRHDLLPKNFINDVDEKEEEIC